MICSRCQGENPAEARFCMHCGAPLRAGCSNCGAELPAAARFCVQCGQPVRARSAADQARHSRLAAATPAPLLAKARQASVLAGERRVVTVLYVDVVDSTILAREIGDERWAVLLNRIFDWIAPAIFHYEGTIGSILGDSLWAFFGAPVAHEDDPARAVRAGLELLEIARDLLAEIETDEGIAVRLRACVHTGPIIIGAPDRALGAGVTARGSAINVAARLKFAAAPMTVFISGQTERFIAPLFATIDRGEIDIKGRSEPVRLFQVDGPRERPVSTRGLAGLTSRMVGRDRELATLIQLAQTVRAGLGRAAIVSGEPGLGKTRLIAEWRATLSSANGDAPLGWVTGHARSYGQGVPYHLLADVARHLLRTAESAGDAEVRHDLEELLGQLFAPPEAEEIYLYLCHLLALPLDPALQARVDLLEPQALQTQYREAVRRLLLGLARHQPLVVVLEDLHWADPSSVDVLLDLLPLSASAPLLWCLVTRVEQNTPGWRLVTAARQTLGDGLTEIALAALSDPDSRALIANLLQIEELPDPVRRLILEKAEGNPFFVEEVIRMLIDRRAIIRRNGGWTAGRDLQAVEIPDNLQGLLTARIDQLPDDVRQTLRVAAVIGRQFSLKVLERVLGEATP